MTNNIKLKNGKTVTESENFFQIKDEFGKEEVTLYKQNDIWIEYTKEESVEYLVALTQSVSEHGMEYSKEEEIEYKMPISIESSWFPRIMSWLFK